MKEIELDPTQFMVNQGRGQKIYDASEVSHSFLEAIWSSVDDPSVYKNLVKENGYT